LHLFNKRIGAYNTVEAAFVIPMALGVMIFIIYLSFYLYGRCILSQDCYILSFRASKITKEMETTPSKYISDKSNMQLGQRYFGSNKPDIETIENGKDIMVTAQNSSHHRAMGSYFIMPSGNWGYEAVGKAQKIDPPGDIRTVIRIWDLYKEIRK